MPNISPTDIEWFRTLLAESHPLEPTDPAPVLSWLETQRGSVRFGAELIGLAALRGWQADPQTGNIRHDSGAFFSIEGVRITAQGEREVNSWDQPIFNQKEGGILALLARRRAGQVTFLLQAKAEPGNLGTLQLAPSLQCTWSNLRQAHKGKRPPLMAYLTGEATCTKVYEAAHNEEGGRFWRKSNSNQILLLPEEDQTGASDHDREGGHGEVNGEVNGEAINPDRFIWASLSQIKALALMDNVLSPFVKTIIAPL